MQNLLYLIAVVLIILWILGYFILSLGALVHVLLVVAAIAVLLQIIQGKKV